MELCNLISLRSMCLGNVKEIFYPVGVERYRLVLWSKVFPSNDGKQGLNPKDLEIYVLTKSGLRDFFISSTAYSNSLPKSFVPRFEANRSLCASFANKSSLCVGERYFKV